MHANYDKIQTSTRGAQLHTGETKDSINYNIDSTFDYNTNAPNTTKSTNANQKLTLTGTDLKTDGRATTALRTTSSNPETCVVSSRESHNKTRLDML